MERAADRPEAQLPEVQWPGPADIGYQSEAQGGAFGQTLASFVKFLDLPTGTVVLDVGTGPGLVVRLLAGRARLAVGSDASREMLAHARSFAPAGDPSSGTWVAADALCLPFGACTFDAATATNVLFLLREPARAVAELARVARRGGVVGWLNPSAELSRASAAEFADQRGLTGFARFSLINYGRIAEQHHRLSGEQWAELAVRAGLEDVVVEGRGGGLMVIVKGRKRRDG